MSRHMYWLARILLFIVGIQVALTDALKGACLPSGKSTPGLTARFFPYQLNDQVTVLNPSYISGGYLSTPVIGTSTGTTDLDLSLNPCIQTSKGMTNCPPNLPYRDFQLFNADRVSCNFILCSNNRGDPVPGMDVYNFPITGTNFTVELTGYLLAPQSGYFTFQLNDVNDAAAISVGAGVAFDCCNQNGNEPPTDNTIDVNGIKPWGQDPASVTSQIYLAKNNYYPVKVVYTNAWADGQLSTSLTLPDGTVMSNWGTLVYSFPQDAIQSQVNCVAPPVTIQPSTPLVIPTVLSSSTPLYSSVTSSNILPILTSTQTSIPLPVTSISSSQPFVSSMSYSPTSNIASLYSSTPNLSYNSGLYTTAMGSLDSSNTNYASASTNSPSNNYPSSSSSMNVPYSTYQENPWSSSGSQGYQYTDSTGMSYSPSPTTPSMSTDIFDGISGSSSATWGISMMTNDNFNSLPLISGSSAISGFNSMSMMVGDSSTTTSTMPNNGYNMQSNDMLSSTNEMTNGDASSSNTFNTFSTTWESDPMTDISSMTIDTTDVISYTNTMSDVSSTPIPTTMQTFSNQILESTVTSNDDMNTMTGISNMNTMNTNFGYFNQSKSDISSESTSDFSSVETLEMSGSYTILSRTAPTSLTPDMYTSTYITTTDSDNDNNMSDMTTDNSFQPSPTSGISDMDDLTASNTMSNNEYNTMSGISRMSNDGTNTMSGINGMSGSNTMSGMNGMSGSNSMSGMNAMSGSNTMSGANSMMTGMSGMSNDGSSSKDGMSRMSHSNTMSGMSNNTSNMMNNMSGMNGMSGSNTMSGMNGMSGSNTMSGMNGMSGSNTMSGMNGMSGSNTMSGANSMMTGMSGMSNDGSNTIYGVTTSHVNMGTVETSQSLVSDVFTVSSKSIAPVLNSHMSSSMRSMESPSHNDISNTGSVTVKETFYSTTSSYDGHSSEAYGSEMSRDHYSNVITTPHNNGSFSNVATSSTISRMSFSSNRLSVSDSSSSKMSLDAINASSQQSEEAIMKSTTLMVSTKTLTITSTVTDIDTVVVTESSSSYTQTVESVRTLTMTSTVVITDTRVIYSTDTVEITNNAGINSDTSTPSARLSEDATVVTRVAIETSTITTSYESTSDNEVFHIISTKTIIVTNILTETLTESLQAVHATLYSETTNGIQNGAETTSIVATAPSEVITKTVTPNMVQGYFNNSATASSSSVDGQYYTKMQYSNKSYVPTTGVNKSGPVTTANRTSIISRSTMTLTRDWKNSPTIGNRNDTASDFDSSNTHSRTLSGNVKLTGVSSSNSNSIIMTVASSSTEDINKNFSETGSGGTVNGNGENATNSEKVNAAVKVSSTSVSNRSSALESSIPRSTATLTTIEDSNLTYHGDSSSLGVNWLGILASGIFMLV